MKTLNAVVKVLAALAAIAGAVYLIAAYGDKLVAWAKRVIGCCPWDEGMEEEAPAAAEAPAEAPAAEEPAAPAEEPAPAEASAEAPAAEEAPAEEPAPETDEPVADEGDFEG